MTGAADFNINFGLGRSDNKSFAAAAFYFGLGIIFGMDVFHNRVYLIIVFLS